MAKRLSRREITRAIPVLVIGTAFGGLGRVLAACTSESSGSLRNANPNPPRNTPPTDDDEFVPGEGTPVDTGDQPPNVPVQVWEARAKQLEDDQARIYGNVFTNDSATNGVMAGKERSHVPSATIVTEGTLKRATVIVQHVMGANGLDAGPYDAAADAPMEAEAGPADAGDGGDAGDASVDASADAAPVDAGKPPTHYITTIYLRAEVGGKDTVVGLWEFQSTDAAPPSVKFTLPGGVTSITAYEWCTLHGLWKSDPIPVT
jgi:desulfoferrodoxin (superoxide reductase-like protein)